VIARWKRALLAALTAALALLPGRPAPAAVDPFYVSRLQEGMTAVERGSYADAVTSLRIACFGMLEDEPQLAACLVRLSLAQAGAGDKDGFAQTFRRLLEGEERVGLYTEAGLDPALQTRFEAKVLEWIPRSVLSTSTAFQRLAADQRETQLAGLASKARRERLAKLEQEEPKVARWSLLAARFEKEQGQPRAAVAAADRALRIDPNLAEARCLRGWARAELGRYADAAEDLAGCSDKDPAFALAELRSRVELSQWGEAEALLEALPAEQRGLPTVEALAKRVEKGVGRRPAPGDSRAAPAEASPAATQQAPGGGTIPAGANPAATEPTGRGAATEARAQGSVPGSPLGGALPPGDETELARAQAQLSRARSAAEIEQAYAIAADLARRHPAHPRVQYTAAEIAYRASRWADAVRHFRQGGDPGEAQPLLLFYLAVSLWETGSRQEAAAVMRRCDGKLRPTPFVQAYRGKILGRTTGS
jgi:tetratricopeptide (TPR) repeat protein